ncbi:MAG: histidinol phosphate phosphatase domain-containing protein [Candidatus Hydrothermarchaeales archaeon]
MPKRYDFHIHSLLTEGELVPSEIARRCSVLDYGAIAITDHVDNSNMEFVLGCLVPACRELEENFDLRVLAGVELTHVPPSMIEKMVKRARELGAQVVVVHGETVAEPVQKGTNLAALRIPAVDILAHPGLITKEEAALAQENAIFLELTSRKGHCLTNGYVAKMAEKTGASLLLNTDAHGPSDLITWADAVKIAAGCGLSEKEVEKVLAGNPKKLLKRIS